MTPSGQSSTPLLEVRRVSKAFPGVQALEEVTFDVLEGEVHCLIGENGAGKSTLIKILAGAQQPDSGELRINREIVRLASTRDAREHGLAFIFQELDVVEDLSVADNLSLGQEKAKVGWGRGEALRSARECLAEVGVSLDPRRPMRSLSLAERQLALIARALASRASIVVMDEPTATLTERECERLFEVIAEQKARGISLIYVSHRLDEIFRIGDRITILRDGKHVKTLERGDAKREEVVQLMVGRPLESMFARTARHYGEDVLRVERLSGCGGRVRDVSFTLHRGEVLGVAGLVGSGRTELARLIFGAEPIEGGEMYLDGVPYRPHTPRAAIRHRVGLVPEERKAQGLVQALTVRENISMVSGRKTATLGFVNRRGDRELAREYIDRLRIRTPSTERNVNLLSGGNQQKVVIAKWLSSNANVLLLDEPTRGVDVGAKSEIFEIIDGLAATGVSILLISSELEEVTGFCDRAVVLRSGQVQGLLERQDLTMKNVMSLAA